MTMCLPTILAFLDLVYKIHASDEGPDGLHLLLTQRHFVRNMLRLQSVKSSDDVIGEKGVDAPHCEHLGLRAVE
jgi:hypothetical protein